MKCFTDSWKTRWNWTLLRLRHTFEVLAWHRQDFHSIYCSKKKARCSTHAASIAASISVNRFSVPVFLPSMCVSRKHLQEKKRWLSVSTRSRCGRIATGCEIEEGKKQFWIDQQQWNTVWNENFYQTQLTIMNLLRTNLLNSSHLRLELLVLVPCSRFRKLVTRKKSIFIAGALRSTQCNFIDEC